MALLRVKEIRSMDAGTRLAKLDELRGDLMHERGIAAMGGAPVSPGKIRGIRRNIARLLTIIREEQKRGQPSSSSEGTAEES